MTTWRRLVETEVPAALAFLSAREAGCVNLTSRLVNLGTGDAEGRFGVFGLFDEAKAVSAVVYVSTQGLVLPMIPDGVASVKNPTPFPELASTLRKASTMIGTADSVERIGRILHRRPRNQVAYDLLERPPLNLPPATGIQGLKVRRAGPADAKLLFPLRTAYEKEEVFTDPDRFDPEVSLKFLEYSLEREVVYVAELDERPVAQAATNARGILYDQIGGVYTVPELRGRGLGRRVMTALLADIYQHNRRACLFVKKSNRPALALYDHLGFVRVDDFAIWYL